MSIGTVDSRPRRRWPVALALAVALPLALVAHGWETAREWWRQSALFETPVPKGTAVNYAGADWRLVSLVKIATRQDGSALVLAELEATVTDKEAFALLPCNVVLSGPGLPNWLPAFPPPRDVRKARPDLADRPSCGTAKVGDIEPGRRILMAESFRLPWMEFERVRLELATPAGRPHYLVFERP